MSQQFDLIVIGAGSGGVRAARMAAGYGARVAIVESRFFGGTCVNVGCVPKKLFAYASEFASDFRLSESFGYSPSQSGFDWGTLRDNKSREIERLNSVYRRLLDNSGVSIFEGHGKVTAPGEISVGGELIRAEHILIATGGKPRRPSIRGGELALISDDFFYLERLPEKVAVVGGGYIACEFAGILRGLGCEVHQIYRGDLFLNGFDQGIRHFVAAQMEHAGIQLHFNTHIQSISEHQDGRHLQFSGPGELVVEQVFYAIGREPNIDDLFAESVQPELQENGAIKVDQGFATSVPGLYAIGDVIDRVQLTPVALAEGMWLARNLFAGDKPVAPLDYADIPTAVFSHPNIASVGLTEEQASRQYGSLRIYTSEFRPLRYSLSDMNVRSLMKLVVDDSSGRVVGLHMAGPEAAEIVQGFAVEVRMGATKADFDRTIGIHPTSAEEFVTMREGVKV